MVDRLRGTDTLRQAYPKINKIIEDSNNARKELQQTKRDLQKQYELARQDVDNVNNRVDNIIQGGGPDKDAELVDIRHPDPNYTPSREINVAGDLVRDIQSQFMKTIVTPIMFGAKGDWDGSTGTDDTVALQNAISFAEETGAQLDGLNKTYLVSDVLGPTPYDDEQRDIGLSITKSIHLKNFNFFLKDNVDDFTTPINVYSPSGHTVIIENVVIDGNRDNQSHSTGAQDGGMHGIRISGDGTNTGTIIIRNCVLKNCESDGLLFRAILPDKAIVESCDFINNTRNGFTDNCIDNIIIRDCRFNDTNGSLPQSGYHCEPDENRIFSNRIIENCTAYGNASNGFYFDGRTHSKFENIKIINCRTDKNIVFTVSSTAEYKNFIKNLVIDNCSADERITISADALAGTNPDVVTDTFIENLNIVNCKSEIIRISSPGENFISNNILLDNLSGRIQLYGFMEDIKVSNCSNVGEASNDILLEVNRYTSNENFMVRNLHVTNCKYTTRGYPSTTQGIFIGKNQNENLTIENSYFDTNSSAVVVEGGENITIKNNKSMTRGDWVPHFIVSEGLNIKCYENEMRERTKEGTVPSGSPVSFPADTIEYNNNLI